MQDWAKECNGSVTVCDRDWTIIYMNDLATKSFAKEGGLALLGTDLRKCHQDRSNAIMARIIETGEANAYTIEKQGVRKFIWQSPWRREGRIAGLVEISVEIPAELPHFVRS